MNETVFEDQFVALQSEFISLCLEVTKSQVNEVYIYISIEEKSKMFNAFFKVDGKVKTLNMLNLERNTIMSFLQLGTADIEKIKKLCDEYQQPVPTEIKISYNMNTEQYNAHYQYKPLNNETSGTVFMNWISENS